MGVLDSISIVVIDYQTGGLFVFGGEGSSYLFSRN